MRIAIVHLSDIHFREDENAVFERVDGISGVLQSWCSECPDLKDCFIVVTGDVAFSGNSGEYEKAYTFFAELHDKIQALDILHRIEYVVVPGNHDCDLEAISGTRQMLISGIPEKENVLIDDSVIDTLTSEQEKFFEFLRALVPGVCSTPGEKLYYERDFAVGECNIRFSCYNTAWMSQRNEQRGRVVFPLEKICKGKGECDLVCAVFHHPYGWFKPENGRAFRRHIETTADIVLTGHEHDLDSYTVTRITGEISDYMEGGILQPQDSEESSFNGVIVDLQGGVHKRFQYYWSGEIYLPRFSAEWGPLHPSKSLTPRFENSESFRESLDDPGVGFTHRHVGHLRLSHIFVYPGLTEIVLGDAAAGVPYKTIAGENVVDYVLNTKQLVVIGANLSGKTSLLKALYAELVFRGFVPVLVTGESITSPKHDRISQLIYDSFSSQYSVDMLEEYKQLPKNKKVLLVDDFDKSRLNHKGKSIFLDFVQNTFERVMVTGTHLVQVEEVAPGVHRSLVSFTHCQIAEFGYVLRRRLIRKWLSLGREYTFSDTDLDYEVRTYENDLNRVIAVRLLPSNPFVVLTILQTIEARVPLETASGSYGHLYEFVITSAIAKSSARIDDLAKKYDFLSALAYYLFDRALPNVTADQITEVEEIFYEKHDIRVDSRRLTAELVQVNVLAHLDGYYTFKYAYLYHYFVARYMRDYLRDQREGPNIQARIETMTKNVFREDYANIVIFLCYLSRDPLIYQAILGNARDIFAEKSICELDEDVSFINVLHPDQPKLLIEEKSVEETSEELLRARDEVSTIADDADATYDTEVVGELSSLDPILKLNVAFKTVQILGQILRNFPTSLGKEAKLELADECYSVGLRALKALFEMIEEDLDAFKDQLGQFIADAYGIEDECEVSERVRKLLFIIPVSLAFAVVKLISYSVGSEELKETYKRVLARRSTTAIRLIDTSIKLDHFRRIPANEIVDLHTELRKNPCSSTLLAVLVVENMFLYHWPYDKRQSTLAKLGIQVTNPRLIESPTKKLPRD